MCNLTAQQTSYMVGVQYYDESLAKLAKQNID